MRDMSIEDLYKDLCCKAFPSFQFQGRIMVGDIAVDLGEADIISKIVIRWLKSWLRENAVPFVVDEEEPQIIFNLDPENKEHELLEIKCFDYLNRGPGFDIANFQSYIREIIDKPYRLHSKYLAIGYGMDIETGTVTIYQVWLKNVWEMCCASSNRPIKVQEKKNVIYNIRPSVWYGNRSSFPTFESLEDFLAAIEQTIYDYNQTRPIAEHWLKNLKDSYEKFYGITLNVPRWYDIKDKYVLKQGK